MNSAIVFTEFSSLLLITYLPKFAFRQANSP